MIDMVDFSPNTSGHDLTTLLTGRTIRSIEIDTTGMDDYLIINFDDCTCLYIRYDYIYGYRFFDRDDPAVSTQTDWIPVSERLPEEHPAWVLVTVDDSLEHGPNFVTEACYHGGDSWRVHGESIVVIAWMPLPEPYQPPG